MNIIVFGIIIAAALLHSSWHAMIKRAPNGMVGLAGMNVVSAGLLSLLPFVAVQEGASGWCLAVGRRGSIGVGSLALL